MKNYHCRACHFSSPREGSVFMHERHYAGIPHPPGKFPCPFCTHVDVFEESFLSHLYKYHEKRRPEARRIFDKHFAASHPEKKEKPKQLDLLSDAEIDLLPGQQQIALAKSMTQEVRRLRKKVNRINREKADIQTALTVIQQAHESATKYVASNGSQTIIPVYSSQVLLGKDKRG